LDILASETYLRQGDEDSEMLGSVTKRQEVLAELKLDSANSMASYIYPKTLCFSQCYRLRLEQQVLDMLRDRLTDALSDLASSRAHAYELQESYASERLTSRRAMADTQAAGGSPFAQCAPILMHPLQEIRIGELTCALKQQQKESLDAITSVGDLEARIEESKAE
jgi:hypothetical protein